MNVCALDGLAWLVSVSYTHTHTHSLLDQHFLLPPRCSARPTPRLATCGVWASTCICYWAALSPLVPRYPHTHTHHKHSPPASPNHSTLTPPPFSLDAPLSPGPKGNRGVQIHSKGQAAVQERSLGLHQWPRPRAYRWPAREGPVEALHPRRRSGTPLGQR